MSILAKFECLAEQAVFSSNKDNFLQSLGLLDILKNSSNQNIRASLSNTTEQFADMVRVVQ